MKTEVTLSFPELELFRALCCRSVTPSINFMVMKCQTVFNPVIIHRYVTLGSNIAKDDKLFEISKLAPLELKFQMPQSENRKLSPGEIVTLSALDSDSIIARARIRRVNPVADATSNTFGYVAEVISGSGLMPGFAVKCAFAARRRRHQLLDSARSVSGCC